MNILVSLISFALAMLVLAQTDIQNQPLMNGYHGLGIVFLGLLVISALSLCAYLNHQLCKSKAK